MNSQNKTSEFDVAIVGFSGKFPGASDIYEYWHNLSNGIESIKLFTKEELVQEGLPAEIVNDPNFVAAAPVLENADKFDAKFFDYTPKEAELIDPQQRILLEIAYSALEHAGYSPQSLVGRTGVYAGSAINSYMINTQLASQFYSDYLPVLLGSDKDFLATRLAYKLGLKGPAITVQTACSTSLVAIHIACQSLISHEIDLALAGAAAVRAPLKTGHLYTQGGVLSPDGHCKPFDEKADGTIFGSGGGVVVLKRLSDALQDQDKIWGIVKGTSVNNDGSLKTDFTAPGVEMQTAAVLEALANSEIDASTIDYVEAHATGTFLGDPIEIEALSRAFREYTTKERFCGIGSVKSNIGHLDAAAGMASLIKVILSMHYEKIPATINFKKPNSQLNIDKSPFFIVNDLIPWEKGEKIRRAGITALGMGGTNAHIVVEEPPIQSKVVSSKESNLSKVVSHELEQNEQQLRASKKESENDYGKYRCIFYSAKTVNSLKGIENNLVKYINDKPNISLDDLSYSLQHKKEIFDKRKGFYASSITQVKEMLLSGSTKDIAYSDRKEIDTVKIALMYPGQGTQYLEMGKNLYENSTPFRKTLEEISEIAVEEVGFRLTDFLYLEDYRNNLSTDINQTSLVQPLLFGIQMAYTNWLKSYGLSPEVIIGHSIGELTAATVSGVFELEAATQIIATRGRLMQEAPTGKMLSVFLEHEKILKYLSVDVDVAAINTDSSVVLSGEKEKLDDIKARLKSDNIRSKILNTSHAFHSSSMESAAEKFTNYLTKHHLSVPKIPIISNISGHLLTDEEATSPEYWGNQIRSTVKFDKGIRTLVDDGYNVFIESGPGTTLTDIVNARSIENDRKIIALSLGQKSDTEKCDENSACNGLAKLWTLGVGFRPDNSPSEKGIYIPLPTYPFEANRYWYEDIKSLPVGRNEASFINRLPKSKWITSIGWNPLTLPIDSYIRKERVLKIFSDNNSVKNISNSLKENSIIIDNKFEENLKSYFDVQKYDSIAWIVDIDETAKTQLLTLVRIAKSMHSLEVNNELEFIVILHGKRLHKLNPQSVPEISMLSSSAGVVQKELGGMRINVLGVTSSELDNIFDSFPNNLSIYEGNAFYKYDQSWMTQVHLNLNIERTPVYDYSSGGIPVVVGAFGGIGKLFVEHIARTSDTVVLVSSTSLSNLTNSAIQSERFQFVEKLKANNINVHVETANISNFEEVKSLFYKIQTNFGRIGCVYNLAGYADPKLSYLKQPEEVSNTLAPKVDGSLNIVNGLKEFPNSRVVLFSSIASYIHPLGQFDYAGANGYQMGMLSKADSSVDVYSIAWAPWKIDDGMGLSIENKIEKKQLDLYNIDPKGAFEVLDKILAMRIQQSIVLPCSLSELQFSLNGNESTTIERDTGESDDSKNDGKSTAEIVHLLWCEVLGFDEIDYDDDYFEVGGTSLMAVKLFNRLEKTFDRKFPVDMLFQYTTINELALEIDGSYKNSDTKNAGVVKLSTKNTNDSKYQNDDVDINTGIKYSNEPYTSDSNEEFSNNQFVNEEKYSDSFDYGITNQANRSLVSMFVQSSVTSTKPLFLVHAHGGLVLWYRQLAKYLGKSRSVYGLQSIGLNDSEFAIDSIQEMASRYVEEVLAVDSIGPYYLAGHCMGGAIAWEIAKNLQQKGKEVAFIGLIQAYHRDVPYPIAEGDGAQYSSPVSIAMRIRLIIDRLKFIPTRNSDKSMFYALFYSLARGLQRKIWKNNDDELTDHNILKVQEKNTIAFWNYDPPCLDIKAFSYTTELQPNHVRMDRTLGWQKASKNLIPCSILPGTNYLSPDLSGSNAELCAQLIEKDLNSLDK